MNAHSPAPTPQPRRRRMRVLLGTVGALVALVVVLVVWRGGQAPPAADQPTTRPSPSSSPAPDPVTPTPTPTAAPDDDTTHPSSCEQLFSPAMVEALDALVLNPTWIQEPDAGVDHGTDDAELQAVIDDAEHLTCVWGSEFGGSDAGLITNLVWVTPERSETVQARLTAAGLSCYEELSGLRCVIQTSTEEGTFGESHFLRDGIWIATKYTNAGPDGYTHDIVANVWTDV